MDTRVKPAYDECVSQGSFPFTTSVIIARESGETSTPRPSIRSQASPEYWIARSTAAQLAALAAVSLAFGKIGVIRDLERVFALAAHQRVVLLAADRLPDAIFCSAIAFSREAGEV
jgi:hypothetical protein